MTQANVLRTLPACTLLALLAAALLASPATAQINGERSFESGFEFSDPEGTRAVTIVSAAMDARLEDALGSFGFFNTEGLRVDDAARVCWQGAQGQGCATGDLRVRVEDGGSVGLRFPREVQGTYSADHVLALWMDFEQGEDLNTYDLGRTLLAPSVGGRMDLQGIPPVPLQSIPNPSHLDPAAAAGLVPLDGDTTIVLDGLQDVEATGACSAPTCTFRGKDVRFSLEGPLRVPAFDVQFGLLPFSTGSTADFRPAADAAAAEGLQFSRINEMLALVEGANAESSGAEVQEFSSNANLEIILQETLSGALLRFPAEGGDASADFQINRFRSMTATADPGGVQTQGSTVFFVADGGVAGAQPLYGVWLFQLPWWGFLLWAAAIGLYIARRVVKPEKTNERWDRYRWIGIVFASLMAILVFILWDVEMAHVFGTSMFTTEANGGTFWATIGIQLATLALVFGVVAAPIQIIIKNTLLLSKQGTFMGLGTGTGILLTYLLGATLLLSYLDLMLGVVL